MILLERLAGCHDARLRGVHRLDAALEDFLGRVRSEGGIESAGGRGDLGEAGLVEFRLDRLSCLVANEVLASVVGANRNERALRRSNAHGEDTNSEFLGSFGGCEAVRIEFFAVGENDKGTCLALGFSESFLRRRDGGGDVRSAFRNHVGVEFVEGIDDG